MSEPAPVFTISIGDPSGIGPEVTVKACADESLQAIARWVIVGEAWQVQKLASGFGLVIDQVIGNIDELLPDSRVSVLDANQIQQQDVKMGQVSAACGEAAVNYVRIATELCLAGKSGAIVTAPLNKEAVAATGRKDFCGHTEFIARMCGRDTSRMLLVNDQLCVVHVTTHCSLLDAATQIDIRRIRETMELGHAAMLHLGFENPRLCICGLNPHAGENGMFGNEEATLITPAVEQARAQGIDISGPFPADTLFMQAVRGKCDMIVAMYHDQGHVPMKLLDFEHTVNVTLGLPIIRTSVDHGTAFDIAGQGVADPEDMKTAMRLAVKMAK